MPRSTPFAYMVFIEKYNEINESYKLCQVRGKHTVGGIVFYKHLFLVQNQCILNVKVIKKIKVKKKINIEILNILNKFCD